ncbi:MAG: transglutaminase-like domain-containing protein [Opitutaceae bacterium]
MNGKAWRRNACRAAMAAVAASTALGAAPEWLQGCLSSTQPPWRPTANAVQLLDSTQISFTTAQRIVAVYRSARRLQSEAGLPRLTFAIAYNADTDRVVSAEAWSVSPDGKQVRSFERGAFLDHVLQFNQYFWNSERVLQFDGQGRVQTGGTVAWEVKIEKNLGFSTVGTGFLPQMMTLRSVYEVAPAPGTRLEWFSDTPGLGTPSADPGTGSLRWELARLSSPALGPPTGFHPNPMIVSVRCVPADAPANHKETWGDFSRTAAQIMDPRMDPGGAVKAQADQLVAGKTARWERIRALAEFVQAQIVYLEITLDKDSVAGYRPHPAAEVLRNRYGDCKDKATLLVSMLRAIGEDGRVVLLMAQNPTFVRSEWPSNQFNHAIAAIRADADVPAGWPVVDAGTSGKWVIFDPTDSITPLGVLSRGDQGGFGLLVDPAQGALMRLPAPEPEGNGMKRKIEAVMDPQGALSVKVDEQYLGSNGAVSRQERWALPKDRFQSVLEQRIHRTNPLASNVQWSDDWDAAGARYRLSFGFAVPTYGRALGGGLVVLAPDILPRDFTPVHWQGRRDGVCWIGADAVDDELKLSLPPGCSVEELPDPYSENGKAMSCELSYRSEGNLVLFRKKFLRSAGFYDESAYHGLEGFYQRLTEAERRPIVLRKAPSS